jgi:hypothetical protein
VYQSEVLALASSLCLAGRSLKDGELFEAVNFDSLVFDLLVRFRIFDTTLLNITINFSLEFSLVISHTKQSGKLVQKITNNWMVFPAFSTAQLFEINSHNFQLKFSLVFGIWLRK